MSSSLSLTGMIRHMSGLTSLYYACVMRDRIAFCQPAVYVSDFTHLRVTLAAYTFCHFKLYHSNSLTFSTVLLFSLLLQLV